ncbi:MAG: hypothetical protein C4532_11820 [Candidatus Abyssobacteria bacterium SURF_17]|uniref:LamG domain-containing protein n=1 Tax=Candidatus Abyssobacteria bacterium SURF_17 TaxID=2093361 RepID=A0A419EWP0_9BACT|nr:MAG: hypothetical protein C4532_11820 [Candidatus Abyssubacteria bacterium SURF_17]
MRKAFAGVLIIAVLCMARLCFAVGGTYVADSAITAGDVVIYDTDVAYGVSTTTTANSTAVAGVALDTVASGSDVNVNGYSTKATVNVTGTVTRGQWLVTSTTAGKASGTSANAVGIFGRAITNSGNPGAGQVYATVNVGYFGLAYSAGGEVNTGSNVGAGGVGPFDAKVDVDLQFRNINAASSKITVTHDDPNNEIDIDVVPGQISHQDLNGAGTSTHSEIDTHLGSTSNPHGVTAAQAGAAEDDHAHALDDLTDVTITTPAEGEFIRRGAGGWVNVALIESHISNLLHNAGMVGGIYVNQPNFISDRVDGYVVTYNETSEKLELAEAPGASGGEANTASNLGSGVGVFEQKSLTDLQFNSLTSPGGTLSIAEDDPNNEIEIDIAEGGVGATEIATDGVGADEIAAGAVGTAEIADGGVNIAKQSALRVSDNGGLQVAFNGAFGRDDAASYVVTAGTLDLTDDATNYVFVHSATRAVTFNTTGFPLDAIPLAIVTTASGDISSVSDRRSQFVRTHGKSIKDREEYYTGFLGAGLDDVFSTATSGGGSTIALISGIGGIGRLTCGTASGSYARVALGTDSLKGFSGSKNAILEAWISLASATGVASKSFGFSDAFAATTEYAVFIARSGVDSGNWVCSTKDGTSEQTNTGISSNTWRLLRVEISSSAVKYFIDGSLVATHTTYVPDDPLLCLISNYQLGDPGAAESMDVDALYVAQER